MHLLFDLDGTLADSRRGIVACMQHALSELNIPVDPREDFLWCIGPPIREAFEKLVGADHCELGVAKYRERYSSVGLFEADLYEGMEKALNELSGQGHILHVCTSKAEVYAVRIIEHFGLARHFTSITGSDLGGTRSAKTELVAHVLASQSIAPRDAMMIGDRLHDMIGANANHVMAIGALWGYGTGAELMDAGAKACVRVPQLLPEVVTALANSSNASP